MTESNMDYRLGIVALGFLFDFEGFVAGSNGAASFGLRNQVRIVGCSVGRSRQVFWHLELSEMVGLRLVRI